MGKALIITEKPSVTKDIVEALGGFKEKSKGEYYESEDYICTYAVGHILTLFSPEDISPEYKRWRLNNLPIIPEKFEVKPVARQKGRIEVIKKLIDRKDVDRLINACDAAREGELIFREIIKYFGTEKPIERLWLQSMTKQAIRNGFKKLVDGHGYDGLAAAAECRAHADWLIGMNATRALTVRLKSRNQRGMSWSAGRVQTPTLALLVQRELEVLKHRPVSYWKVQAKFQAESHAYDATWFDPKFKKSDDQPDHREDRIFDQKAALAILKEIEGQKGEASEIRKPRPVKAPHLFDLTSLQRRANSRFGWPAARTLRAAQRCYETHKVLTYPRTSSKCLPEDYRPEVDRLLGALAESEFYAPHANYLKKNGLKNDDGIFNDAGVTDHFAIIPTGEIRELDGDDQKLFDLVTRNFLAAFYPPAIYEEVERITEVAKHSFKSKPPKVLKDAGWEAVFDKKVGTEDGREFPPLVPGQDKVEGVGIGYQAAAMEDHETKPPARISEAGLLSLMENAGRRVEDESLATVLKAAEGLGTAATRADIIENLKVREYIDANLRPTVKGIRLIDVLHRIKASRITSAELTAALELHLNEVESGTRTAGEFMDEIISYVQDVVLVMKDFDYEEIYPSEEPLGKCPKCQGDVYEKAWFYGCLESTKRVGTKSCDFLIWKDHNGRYIDRATVSTLLTEGVTRELDGFRSASGKMYKAVLALENGELVRRNVDGSEEDVGGLDVNSEPIGPCPIHKDEGCQIVETPREFICEILKKAKEDKDNDTNGFSFPRMLCKREIKREELRLYLETGETEFLAGFVSKRGRKFSAKLQQREDGAGFTFVFPERTSKSAKKKEDGAETDGDQAAAVESAPLENAPAEETTVTKAGKAKPKRAAGRKKGAKSQGEIEAEAPESSGKIVQS